MAFEKGLVLRSEKTLDELVVTFTKPKFDKYISIKARIAAVNEFERRSILINVTDTIKACRDPKDDIFLSLAVSANAECIITGDNDLLVLNPFRNISIITPAEFLKNF